MKKRYWHSTLTAASVIAIALGARGDESHRPRDWPTNEFEFARLQYSDGGYGWRGGSWRVDYDEAEYHFTEGVGRLTRVQLGRHGVIVNLSNDSIFDYPWLYAVEVGYWRLSDYEAQRLREYLLRGGFLMVDDFHGMRQWVGFTDSLNRVFPDRPIVELPESAEVLHVLYDLNQRIQIPGIAALMRGRTYEEEDDKEPHWRGIYDDSGRLMLAINYNMDLGDAWEHADDPGYPNPMTALAYRFAVNYVVYAMTH